MKKQIWKGYKLGRGDHKTYVLITYGMGEALRVFRIPPSYNKITSTKG